MNYLLDTNVISAIAPTKRDRPVALARWLDQASEGLYISVVTVAEIRDGIAKLSREGASGKAASLAHWWSVAEHLYGDRMLPFDLAAATAAGALSDKARAAGHAPGFADIAIAATAQVHGLTILTRNIRHFAPTGIAALDPFDTLPPLPGGAMSS